MSNLRAKEDKVVTLPNAVSLATGDQVRVLIDPTHAEDPPKGATGSVSFVDERDPNVVEVKFPGGIASYWGYELEKVA